MVSDARRFEPLSQYAADLLEVLAEPDRLTVCCSLISGEQTIEALEKSLMMQREELLAAVDTLIAKDVLDQKIRDGQVLYRLADIQAAEVVDALCSAFLGEDFSNRAKVPFRSNKRLVGGYGKFEGANI